MEQELEARLKVLPFKVKGASKELQAQKAAHVLDTDLRNYWSTSTNTKEWILFELEEPCLLSHIRIHNKSVLEWEISMGLKFKPESFIKVKPRCEAPRREIQYPIGFVPCRFVRISCLRGSPIAIFFVQLIGINVPGLEPELQSVVDYLLPHITSHKQDTQDLHLQLLQDIALRLSPFIPHLEGELAASSEMELKMRFLAMLAGPFYPILSAVSERENAKNQPNGTDQESLKSNQASVFTVSSNFQAPPRRSRSPLSSQQPLGQLLAFHPDAVLLLLRGAYKDNNSLGFVCRLVARLFQKLVGPAFPPDMLVGGNDQPSPSVLTVSSTEELETTTEVSVPFVQTDYSSLFGEEFLVCADDGTSSKISTVVDIAAVEEGLLHLLFAVASQPILCRRLVDAKPDLSPALPFIQAILPALRPVPSGVATSEQFDESFSQWQAPMIQRAVSQVVALVTTASYRPLLDACSGYLCSYLPAHAKAACVLIDLCSGPLAPWLPMVIAKVELAIELVEDIMDLVQAANQETPHARAALICIMLGLSGHMDDTISQFKAVKQKLIFLVEMLEPYLIPAINPITNTIAFGDVSAVVSKKQEQNCALALDLLRKAIQKPGILPALEAEWRHNRVIPSVLLSTLAPHAPLPPGIDLRKFESEKHSDPQRMSVEDLTRKGDSESNDDPAQLFAPINMRVMNFQAFQKPHDITFSEIQETHQYSSKNDAKQMETNSASDQGFPWTLDLSKSEDIFNLQADCLLLANHEEQNSKASEFIQFANSLYSQTEPDLDSQSTAIDALLLAAECHLNPFFMSSLDDQHQLISSMKLKKTATAEIDNDKESYWRKDVKELESISNVEEERDKAVLRILLKAAEWDRDTVTNQPEKGFQQAVFPEYEDISSGIEISEEDKQAEDATTLLRKHQNLLCRFLVHRLLTEQKNIYEVLLDGLLFFLSSATQLSCPPEFIVDVLLETAERLNVSLIQFQNMFVNSKHLVGQATILSLHRLWAILLRLLNVTSGDSLVDDAKEMESSTLSNYRNLVPVYAWMSRIKRFSSSRFPLVRFAGWKALARFFRNQKQSGVFLALDMAQLTSLLLIFSDDLTSVGDSMQGLSSPPYKSQLEDVNEKVANVDMNDQMRIDQGGSANVLHPEIKAINLHIRAHFKGFANVMLEFVCLQLKIYPRSSMPDILSWFSEFCRTPFADPSFDSATRSIEEVKGFAAVNVRYVILHLLEAIVSEHMEALAPELPRLIGILLSLCQSSCCDVALLESVLTALKPIISYAMDSVAASESQLENNPSVGTFEDLCFESLMEQLKYDPDVINNTRSQGSNIALMILISAFLVSDLSSFKRKKLMHLLLRWVKFTGYCSTGSYYNFICAFQRIFESCDLMAQGVLEEAGLLPYKNKSKTGRESLEAGDDIDDLTLEESGKNAECLTTSYEDAQSGMCDHDSLLSVGHFKHRHLYSHGRRFQFGSAVEVEEFSKSLQMLFFGLASSIEKSWNLHCRLVNKLTQIAARCVVRVVYLNAAYATVSSTWQDGFTDEGASENRGGPPPPPSWQMSLEAVVQLAAAFQQNHCWQVAASVIHFVLSLPPSYGLGGVLRSLCSALEFRNSHAPRIAWRLQPTEWLARVLIVVGSEKPGLSLDPLAHLICVMLEHSEPEQRVGALIQLHKCLENESSRPLLDEELVDRDDSGLKLPEARGTHIMPLVSATWDRVASLATCDSSLSIRNQAMKLLLKYIPLAQPQHLSALLSSAEALLPGLPNAKIYRDGVLTRLALEVFARAALYSSPTDIDAISPNVWSSLEVIANSKSGGIFLGPEQAVCAALLQLKEQNEHSKQAILDLLSMGFGTPEQNPDFIAVKETVLQIWARLTTARVAAESEMAAVLRNAKELEEMEMELELRKERKSIEAVKSEDSMALMELSAGMAGRNVTDRLQEIRAQILIEEKSVTRSEIAARLERQRIARHERQLALEAATLREIELLQELDRERAAESEREIERQKALERERAKTRDLRHALDLEMEKRAQRDLQRDLDQRESGSVRSSRRDFPGSSSTSRPRERYREREGGGGASGRGQDSRPSSGGGGGNGSGNTPPATPTAASVLNASASSNSMASTTILTSAINSRAYPGQLTFSRERTEERLYDDGVDRESVDGIGYGDLEPNDSGGSLSSLSGIQRQGGGRVARARQLERRERDGRREGKWERKHM